MEAVQNHGPAGSLIPAAHGGLTAIVVDDDRHVRSYLARLLRGLQVMMVAEAGDAAEGLRLYERLRPSIVLLDIDLPSISVADAMQRLRAVDPDVAVIALTSRRDAKLDDPVVTLGLLGCVPIYVVREEVAQKISSALDRLAWKVTTPRRMTA